jgi:hypothetical protein
VCCRSSSTHQNTAQQQLLALISITLGIASCAAALVPTSLQLAAWYVAVVTNIAVLLPVVLCWWLCAAVRPVSLVRHFYGNTTIKAYAGRCDPAVQAWRQRQYDLRSTVFNCTACHSCSDCSRACSCSASAPARTLPCPAAAAAAVIIAGLQALRT